jgi:hypothetical protein
MTFVLRQGRAGQSLGTACVLWSAGHAAGDLLAYILRADTNPGLAKRFVLQSCMAGHLSLND